MSQLVERYHFIHNVFANFYKDTLDFFTDCIYPRFQYSVIGTYNKGVEYIAKQCEYGREIDKPILPALILNPSGDFAPADANAGGRQYWRYPNLAPSMIKRLFNAIYKDQHVQIHVGFLRVKGEIEFIMLLNSFYEYCDVRMLMINLFGGMDRIIQPRFFSSFIVLPDTMTMYNYKNSYTGANYFLDWSSAGASEEIVKTTATNEWVLPVNIKPQFSLTNLSDSSNRYGGADNIAEWKLSATVNFELELPNYLVLETDYLAEKVELEVQYGSVYSANNDYQPPDNRQLFDYEWNWGLNYNTNTPDKLGPLSADDATCVTTFVGDYVFARRYFHIVTAEEAATCDSTSNIEISLPEQIDDPKILIVNSKDGKLSFGDHYWFTDNGWTLVIKTGSSETSTYNSCPPVTETHSYICLQEGWVLELYVYLKLESLSERTDYLLKEDGFKLLQEDLFALLLE